MNSTPKKELIGQADLHLIFESREIYYRIFSNLFFDTPFDGQYLKQLLSALDTLKASLPSEAKGEELRKAFSAIKIMFDDIDMSEMIATLSKEYTRLFLLGKSSLPLSASPHFSPSRTLYQEPRTKVKRIYDKSSLKINCDQRIPEDHLGVELSYLSFMSVKVLKDIYDKEMVIDYLNTQILFINEHLLPLITVVYEKLSPDSHSGFYNNLLVLTKEYIKYDLAMLNFITDDEEILCLG